MSFAVSALHAICHIGLHEGNTSPYHWQPRPTLNVTATAVVEWRLPMMNCEIPFSLTEAAASCASMLLMTFAADLLLDGKNLEVMKRHTYDTLKDISGFICSRY